MKQPPRLKDQKTKITKFFTMNDFIELGIIFIFSLAIGISLFYNFQHWVKLIAFISILLTLLPLILPSRKNNAKYYVVLWRIMLYWFSPKTYKKSTERDTTQLMPYSCLYNEYTVKNKKSKLRVFSQHNIDNYFMVLKVNGFNLWNEDNQTQIRLIEEFADILNILTHKHSFIKIPETLDYSGNIEYINNIGVQKGFWKEYQKSNLEDFKKLKINQLVDNFYLIINSESFEQLTEQYEALVDKLETSFISVERLENYRLLVFLKNLNMYNCTIEEIEDFLLKEDIYNVDDTLEELFKYDEVKFKLNTMKINDDFISIQCLNKLPTNLNEKWIKHIFESEGTVIWKNIPFQSENQTERLLNKVDRKMEQNSLEILNATDNLKNDISSDNLSEMIRQITEDGYAIFDTNFYVISRAKSEQELKNVVRHNNQILRKSNIKMNDLKGRQFFAFSDVVNYPFTRLQKEFYEITTINLSHGFPFEHDNLNDNKNLLLGFSRNTKAPISFDLFDLKHSNRTNHNMFILGSSGMGKSTLVMKILASSILAGNKALIIDPQAEYLDFARKFNGQIIDLGSGVNTCINPLQVRNGLKGQDSKENMVSIINSHMGFLKIFFQTLFKFDESNNKLWNFLSKAILEFYSIKGVYKLKSVDELKNEEWGTISDLIVFLKTRFKKPYSQDKVKLKYIDNEIIEVLEILFTENGKYEQLYNGHTTIKIQNDLVVFNTANLNFSTDKETSNLAIMMIINFMNEIIFKNWLENEAKKQEYKEQHNIKIMSADMIDKIISRVVVCIDEEHLFIDPNKPEILNYIVETTKTIRKYDGGTIHTTQNPSDYKADASISESAKRIIQNCQYSFFFGLKDDDIDAVKELFKHSQTLLRSEVKYLASREKGRVLAAFTNHQRMRINLYYNDLEKELFFKKGF